VKELCSNLDYLVKLVCQNLF